MNKSIKFHKPSSPAFHEGQVWASANGSRVVEILCVFPWPVCVDKWSYSVRYKQSDGTTVEKGVWDFQVRYTHLADFVARDLFESITERNNLENLLLHFRPYAMRCYRRSFND